MILSRAALATFNPLSTCDHAKAGESSPAPRASIIVLIPTNEVFSASWACRTAAAIPASISSEVPTCESEDIEAERPFTIWSRAMLHWRLPRWRLITFPVGLAATVALLDDDGDAIGLPVAVVTVELEVFVFWFWFVLPSSLLDAVAVAFRVTVTVTNLVFGGGQSVDEVDAVMVPRAADDVARTDDELVTEADETVVLVAVATDEVEVEVDLRVDPSFIEETTVPVAVALDEVGEADLVVESPLLLMVPFLSLFI